MSRSASTTSGWRSEAERAAPRRRCLEPLDPATVAVERIPDYDAPRRPVSDDRKRSERLYTDDRKLRGKGKKRKKPFLEDFFE